MQLSAIHASAKHMNNAQEQQTYTNKEYARRGQRGMYTKENQGVKTVDVKVYKTSTKTHSHTQAQITQSLRGAAQPDKTGSLRAIYGHLMHNDPPISGCVGREAKC